jgi:hypothetical protein
MPNLHESVAYCQGLCDTILAIDWLEDCSACGARVCGNCSRAWRNRLLCPTCYQAELRADFTAKPRERWETT